MARRNLVPAATGVLAVLLVPACGSDVGSGGGTETGAEAAAESLPQVAADVAAMRAATARYADDVDAAVADGHFMITRHMPDQGYHFLNPDAPEEFDPSVPQILMYARDGDVGTGGLRMGVVVGAGGAADGRRHLRQLPRRVPL